MAFVADPNVVTIYNRAQRYERAPLSPDGDRCEWFALSDDVARGIVGGFDPAAAEQERGPFIFEHAPSTADLYLAQRSLARRATSVRGAALDMEEAVVGLVARVLALAYQRPPARLAVGSAARRRRRDLVEHAKAELARTVTVNRAAADLARTVGTSVFHLCRIFRAHTGRTMHEYRTELRVRVALEMLAGTATGSSLSRVAYELGFASHAHFVRHCRQHFGAPPRVVRAQFASTNAVIP